MKTLQIIKFYGNSTWNESNHVHQNTKRVDSVWKQDLYVLLKWDNIASQPKGWIQGNMRSGLVLEVTTSFQSGKHGIEIRIWSVGQDNSQSWVRTSYGTNKYVIDSNHNNTEFPADPHENQTSQTNVKVIASRSKAKAKPQKSEPVDVPSIIPMNERKWIDIEPSLSLRTKSRRK